MSAAVTEHIEGLRVLLGQDAELAPVRDRPVAIDDLAVDLAGDGGLAESGADAGRDLSGRRARRDPLHGSVGKDELEVGGHGGASPASGDWAAGMPRSAAWYRSPCDHP